MNKKIIMFIICVIFALIISCKNYAISKDSKDIENSEQVVKGSKEVEKEVENKFDKLLDTLNTLDIKDINDTKEIEEQIKKLKETIDKTDPKKTPIGTYSEYEEKVKKIKEELEKKLKDKKEIEEKLKELEESLKKKKEERKQKLEEAKKKFEGYKKQVESAGGETYGHTNQNQGRVGAQAFKEAKDLGLNVNSSCDSDTGDMSKGIIEDALQKIEEELKEIDNK
ncbi:ErpL protein (plasmid) [Borreliella yangtzensis]